MLHELWDDEPETESFGGSQLFCLAGPEGDGARALLAPGATLVWTVEAGSHFEAMTLYYEYQGWGTYTTDWEGSKDPYPATGSE